MEKEEIFYHYCSCEAFKSIIEKGYLWLSNTSVSNDYGEFNNAIKVFFEYLKIKNYKETASLFSDCIDPEELIFLHSVSFSTKQDDLGQWCRYGQDGSGFAIGFNKNIFPECKYDLFGKSKQGCTVNLFFDKVIYSDEEKYKLFAEYIDKDFSHNDIAEKPELYQTIFSMLPKFKDKAFADENEYRLIYDPIIHPEENKKLECTFSMSKYGLCSHYHFPIEKEKNTILEVWVGPKNLTLQNILEQFLQANGYKNVKIHKSSITYR